MLTHLFLEEEYFIPLWQMKLELKTLLCALVLRFEGNLDDGIHEQEESNMPKGEEGPSGRVQGDLHQLSALVVRKNH